MRRPFEAFLTKICPLWKKDCSECIYEANARIWSITFNRIFVDVVLMVLCKKCRAEFCSVYVWRDCFNRMFAACVVVGRSAPAWSHVHQQIPELPGTDRHCSGREEQSSCAFSTQQTHPRLESRLFFDVCSWKGCKKNLPWSRSAKFLPKNTWSFGTVRHLQRVNAKTKRNCTSPDSKLWRCILPAVSLFFGVLW